MEFSDPAVEELARRLRMGRASANLTQAQAAEIAQISQSALSLYEKAKREPHAMALMRLAKASPRPWRWAKISCSERLRVRAARKFRARGPYSPLAAPTASRSAPARCRRSS